MKAKLPSTTFIKIAMSLMIGVLATFSSIAQNIYCNGPWGGAGAIGDPARWTYIGQAGNSNDAATGKGAVSYGYSYFDRFVRIGDWVVFLNSVDPSGSGNYSGLLGDNGLQLITYNGSQWVARSWSCAGTGQSLTASQVSKVAVSYVSFNLACRFANWVATGSVSSGAYTFASSAANANVTSINYAFQGVRLPTENEFYKAAYYNPTTSSYNTYGATNLSGGDPVQTNVSSNATLVNQSGSPYQLSMAGLGGGPNGTHCLWQIQAGQGDRSAYGLFNMVGGFHHLLTINQGGSQDATAGLMMFRPGNQLEGPSGQSKYWSYPGSASDGGWTMNAHLASPSFHLVIVGNECGGCPTLSDPVVTNGSRCGTGTVTTSLTTSCTTAGSSLHIYSEVGLTNDITSQFTIVGSSITTPSITSTKTYYAVCQSTSSATTCFSDSDAFTATVTTAPTATASATQPSCTGTNSPNNGGITIAGFTTGQRYQYTSGATFTGTATPATITAIPVGGVVASTLANTSGTYTVRIYHSTDNTCFVDRTVNITAVTCTPTCITPTVKGYGRPATCSNGTANNDASINLYNLANVTKYGYSIGLTYAGPAFASATTATGTTATITGLSGASTNITYTVRIFNGSNTCFTDIRVTVPYRGCNTTCTINGGADQLICEPTTTTNLPDATAAQEWIIGNNNPVAASINATTGVVTGMTANGIYSFILRDKVTTTCADEVYIFRGVLELPFVSSCESSYQLPTTTGAVWTVASGSASVTADGLISGMNSNGSYQFNVTYATCSATITVEKITCAVVCTTPDAGTDITMCLPKTRINLADAAAGTQWVVVSGNPATAAIDATTGEITGLTVTGTYTFSLQTIGDPTCKDDIQIMVTDGDTPTVLCDNGTTSYTLTAPATLTNIIWYNMAGTQVGTGATLAVTSNTLGLADGAEAYYYEGESTTLNGCDIELCCPVKFITQTCCPTPNCGTVTVIKN